jgi:hypothetical protein
MYLKVLKWRLRAIFVPKEEKATGDCTNCVKRCFILSYFLPSIIGVKEIEDNETGVPCCAHGAMINTVLSEKLKGKRLFGIARCRQKDNIKTDLKTNARVRTAFI